MENIAEAYMADIKGGGPVTEEKIRLVAESFAREAKKIYGSKLHEIIFYGSCVRGDFKEDSDIDLFVLLNVASDEISRERKRILDVADRLDLHYDVVLAPVFQSLQLYEKYGGVSVFYQTIRREGVKIA